jgi:hypothetical protein
MRRLSTLIAMPLAATALLAASIAVSPAPEAAAQATPAAKPTAKPAGAATTAPRAGGIPLELAGALVAGGSAVVGGGLYALRRKKRPA